MRIAILSCFYPLRGGIAQFNANILTELGKTCEVKAFNFSRQYPDILFPGKTQYVTPEDNATPVESEAVLDTANPFNWIKTARKIRKWSPDVLVVRYWMSWFAPSLGIVSRLMDKKCKVVAIIDNVIPHEPHFFDKPLSKFFFNGVDSCITLCDSVSAELEELCPGKRKITIPHPKSSQFGERISRGSAEKALGLEPGYRNILFFGLIREYKGLDILLEAFEKLSDKYQLIVAGEPYGSFEKYQEIIDKSPAKSRIKLFLNYIADSEVKNFFSAADVTVLPYRSATQSGVSNTSDNFEVPMIVTDVGGLKETIGDKGTGLVAEEVNADSVAKAIEKFFEEPGIRESCIEAIRRENKLAGWDNFCLQFIKFVEG